MSTTDGRRERMQRLLKCLYESKNSAGLTPNEIAQRTQLLTEIQMDRLFKYLAELEWGGMIIRHGNRYRIMDGALDSFIKNEREKKKVKEKAVKKEKKVEMKPKKAKKIDVVEEMDKIELREEAKS